MRTRIILAATVAACVGCIHSKEVEHGVPKEQPQAPRQPPKETRPPAEEGRPELSTSAEGLMLPQGPQLIQEALVKRGYLSPDHHTGKLDEETSAAIRQFQTAEHVARTGYPDRETVRRLGLGVDQVFKATGENQTTPQKGR